MRQRLDKTTGYTMFELAMPWVLVLVIIPPVIWFFVPRAPLNVPVALKIPFYKAMLGIIDRDNHFLSKQIRMGLFFIIWALLVFAMSGPRWVGEPVPLTREGRNIMLVLDLSGSMELDDMLVNGRPVSRLAVVKAAAKQFVQARAGDRIGLILFGSQAYLQTPLTYDRHSVLMRIDDASVGLAGKSTAIGDGLGLAVKRLQNVPAASRVIILLTDGVNNSGVLQPLKAAELAKDDHIKVYTIGLGSEIDPRAMGNNLFSFGGDTELDEKTLEEIAKMTGARYFRATDTQSLHDIYKTINELETVSQDEASVRPQKEYYFWPLALALVVFLYWLAEKSGLFSWRSLRRSQETLP